MDEIEYAEQEMLSDRWLEWVYSVPSSEVRLATGKLAPPPFVHNDSGIDLSMMAVEQERVAVAAAL